MALNNLGLGFSFGYQDRGLGSYQKKTADRFGSIATSMDLSSKASDKLNTSLDRLSTSMPVSSLRDTSGSIDGLRKSVAGLNKALDPGKMAASGKAMKDLHSGLEKLSDPALIQRLQGAQDTLERFSAVFGGIKSSVSPATLSLQVFAAGVAALTKQMLKGLKVGIRFAKFLGRGLVKGFKKTLDIMSKTKDYLAGPLSKAWDKFTGVFGDDIGVIGKGLAAGKKGFELMGKAVLGLKNTLSKANLQKVISSMGVDKLKGSVSGLFDEINGGVNLTSGFEADMQAKAVSARKLGANMGYSGKALNKFTGEAASLAYNMNIGEEATAKAIRGWHEAGTELEAMGFKSAKSFARFTEGYGIDADLVRNQSMRMTRELGMTPEAVHRMTSSMFEFGTQSGDVAGAMGKMKEMADLLQRAELLGKKPEEMEAMVVQTNALSAALMLTGQDSTQAYTSAIGLTDTMLTNQEAMRDMMKGASSEFPAMAKAAGISTGTMEAVWASFEKGPEEFLTTMNKSLDPKQMDFFIAHMGDKLGSGGKDIVSLMKMMKGEAGPEIIAAMEKVKKARVDFDAKGEEVFRSGLTRQQRWERMNESFEHSFRSIGRTNVNKTMRETSKEFKKFNKNLKKTVEKGGPMGAFIEKMSEAHQIGVTAFIPNTLRPMALLMGGVAAQAAPAVTALGSMGFRLKSLVSPFGLVAAGAAGLGVAFLKLREGEKAFTGGTEVMIKSRKAFKRGSKQVKSMEKQLAKMADRGEEGTAKFQKMAKALTMKKEQVEFAKGERASQAAMASSTKAIDKLDARRMKLEARAGKKKGRGRERKGDKKELEDIESALDAQWKIRDKANSAGLSRNDRLQDKARQRSRERIKEYAQTAKDMVTGFVQALPMIAQEVVKFVQTEAVPLAKEMFAGFGGGLEVAEDILGSVFNALSTAPWSEYSDKAVAVMGNILNKAGDLLKKIPFAGIAVGILEFASKAVVSGLNSIAEVDWGAKVKALFTGAGSILNSLLFGGSDEATAGSEAGVALRNTMEAALIAVGGIMSGAATGWWSSVVDAASSGSVINKIKNVGLILGATLIGAMLVIGPLRRKVGGFLKGLFGGTASQREVQNGVEKPLLAAIRKFKSKFVDAVRAAGPQIESGLEANVERSFTKALKDMKRSFFTPFSTQLAKALNQSLQSTISNLRTSIQQACASCNVGGCGGASGGGGGQPGAGSGKRSCRGLKGSAKRRCKKQNREAKRRNKQVGKKPPARRGAPTLDKRPPPPRKVKRGASGAPGTSKPLDPSKKRTTPPPIPTQAKSTKTRTTPLPPPPSKAKPAPTAPKAKAPGAGPKTPLSPRAVPKAPLKTGAPRVAAPDAPGGGNRRRGALAVLAGLGLGGFSMFGGGVDSKTEGALTAAEMGAEVVPGRVPKAAPKVAAPKVKAPRVSRIPRAPRMPKIPAGATKVLGTLTGVIPVLSTVVDIGFGAFSAWEQQADEMSLYLAKKGKESSTQTEEATMFAMNTSESIMLGTLNSFGDVTSSIAGIFSEDAGNWLQDNLTTKPEALKQLLSPLKDEVMDWAEVVSDPEAWRKRDQQERLASGDITERGIEIENMVNEARKDAPMLGLASVSAADKNEMYAAAEATRAKQAAGPHAGMGFAERTEAEAADRKKAEASRASKAKAFQAQRAKDRAALSQLTMAEIASRGELNKWIGEELATARDASLTQEERLAALQEARDMAQGGVKKGVLTKAEAGLLDVDLGDAGGAAGRFKSETSARIQGAVETQRGALLDRARGAIPDAEAREAFVGSEFDNYKQQGTAMKWALDQYFQATGKADPNAGRDASMTPGFDAMIEAIAQGKGISGVDPEHMAQLFMKAQAMYTDVGYQSGVKKLKSADPTYRTSEEKAADSARISSKFGNEDEMLAGAPSDFGGGPGPLGGLKFDPETGALLAKAAEDMTKMEVASEGAKIAITDSSMKAGALSQAMAQMTAPAEEGTATGFMGMTPEQWTSVQLATGGLAGNLATMGSGAATFLGQFSAESASSFNTFFSGLWSNADGYFGKVSGVVDDLFGHSISTDVQADFEKSNTAVTGFLTQLEEGMKKTIEKALLQGFTGSFATVEEKTKIFVDNEIAEMARFAVSSEERMIEMWDKLLEMTDTAITAMAADIGGARSSLSQIRSMHDEAISRRGSIEDVEGAGKGGLVPPDTALKGDPALLLVKAVHAPNWYVKSHRKHIETIIAQNAQLLTLMRKVLQGNIPSARGGTASGSARTRNRSGRGGNGVSPGGAPGSMDSKRGN